MITGFVNANIYVEGKGIIKTSLTVKKGKIVSFEAPENGITLPENLIVVPGFIDKHVHGANGSDSMYPNMEAILNIASTIAKEGVTSFLPTTMTQDEASIKKALENIKNYINSNNENGSRALGVHLEGPFISVKHKGAQVEEAILKCSVEKFKEFNDICGGYIKEVTLAPEEDGLPLCEYLHSQKIVASLGHTDATCEQVIEASKHGATSMTHTYNAMKPLHHREAGSVGGAFLCDEISCELICDLIHVCKDAIRVLYKMKGNKNVCLITDAMEAKHLPDGMYKLGGQDVIVKDKAARLPNGTLAGSTLKMNEALKNISSVLNLSIPEAVDLATINPARVLYIDKEKGSIALTKDADFAVIDKDFNVYMTVREGKVIYQK